jgi:uncharacterized protein (UPF0264 family)
MRLLVSVRSAKEAGSALVGGADFIDAKEPLNGALGAVPVDVLQQVCRVVASRRPVTAALGDAVGAKHVEQQTRQFADAGVVFAKVGLAGIGNRAEAFALIQAAVRGAASARSQCGVVAVAYQDARTVGSIGRDAVLQVASETGASGILLDTANKTGPGLSSLVERGELELWVNKAHKAGLFVALAGKLTAADLPLAFDVGADIVGVRGAACEGGRTGRIAPNLVEALRQQCETLASSCVKSAISVRAVDQIMRGERVGPASDKMTNA